VVLLMSGLTRKNQAGVSGLVGPVMDFQRFTATSGTWTKPDGVSVVWIECIGAGGGGGGGMGSGGSTRNAGGGELPARLYCRHLVEDTGQEAPMALTEAEVAVAALVPLAVTLLAQQKVMVATQMCKVRRKATR
jgi:hypothetical protein